MESEILFDPNVMRKERYTHDCSKCIDLGPYEYQDHSYDLYYCSNEPTILARWGNEGPDYSSGIIFGQLEPDSSKPLSEAYRRAKAKGFALPNQL